MLCELQIENIAVIKKAVITFQNGLNVMTGETGAGKSIVIDAINAVLGERTSRELIRTGCDNAFVSALFYGLSDAICTQLDEIGITPEEDNSLLIQRKLFADGKNQCKINGCTVTVSVLKRISKLLVNIHGQSDNQLLLQPEYHCGYIDALCADNTYKTAYEKAYHAYAEAKSALQAVHIDEAEKQRRLDIYNYQIAELEQANITEGEILSLESRLHLLQNAEHITAALQAAYALLNGDDASAGAVDALFSAARQMEGIADLDASYAALLQTIQDAAYALSETNGDILRCLDADAFDPAELSEIDDRLNLLHSLQRKYGETEAEMLEFLDQARTKRDQIIFADARRDALEAETEQLRQIAYSAAENLHKQRMTAAGKFCKTVEAELAFLDMPSVRFEIHNETGALTENGIDNLEFMLSANAGEAPKPLAKIASGGELSRIMLAMKGVLAKQDAVDTLIFDEIDTGVSGRAAQKIGIKLKQVSKAHQVICVTHLAQIAAFGDTHLRIEKDEYDGQTYTQISTLDFDGRIAELARISGGLTVSAVQLQSAEEMLRAAQNGEV